MQVQFTRSASVVKKGLMGRAIKFELTAMLIADQEETRLFDQYEIWTDIHHVCTGDPKEGNNVAIKVQDLRNGVTLATEWMSNIGNIEVVIVEGLRGNLNYCRSRETFDGSSRIVDVA